MVASGPSFKVFSLSLLPVLKIPKHEANDVKNDEAPLSSLVLLISLLCEYDRSLFINRNDNFKKNMRSLSLSVNGTLSYATFAHLLEKSTYITQISFGNKLNCASIDHDFCGTASEIIVQCLCI